MSIFGNMDINTVITIFTKVIIVFLILPIHEYAHAWAAHKMGDDTASYAGRLTLNPLAHIDWIGAICILFTGFGWAKPVPINPLKFKKQRLGTAITAAAGPLSNLIVAFIALVIYRFIEYSGFFLERIDVLYDTYNNIDECLREPFWASTLEEYANGITPVFIIMYAFEAFITINIGLAIFNLIPIPPLDGSKIIGYFTPAKVDMWLNQNAMIINFVFMAVVLSGVLSFPLGWLGARVREFMWFITNFIPMIMGV